MTVAFNILFLFWTEGGDTVGCIEFPYEFFMVISIDYFSVDIPTKSGCAAFIRMMFP